MCFANIPKGKKLILDPNYNPDPNVPQLSTAGYIIVDEDYIVEISGANSLT